MVNYYKVLEVFQDTEHQLQENIHDNFHFLRNLHYIEKYNLSSQNYLLKAFVALLIHVYYLHLNIEYMTIIYFWILINRVTYSSFYAFSTITNMPISVERPNFTLGIFKALF